MSASALTKASNIFFIRFTMYVVIFAGSNFTVQNISINFQDFKILRSAVFRKIRIEHTEMSQQWMEIV